jgi:hypothetical protein
MLQSLVAQIGPGLWCLDIGDWCIDTDFALALMFGIVAATIGLVAYRKVSKRKVENASKS